MKGVTKLLILLLLPLFAAAQKTPPEKLKDSLKAAPNDSLRYQLLGKLADYYSENNRETCLQYLEQRIALNKTNGKMLDLASDLDAKGYQFTYQQKFPEAFACFQEAKKMADDPANDNSFWHYRNNSHKTTIRLGLLASIHHDLGHLMGSTGNTEQQIAEYRQTIAIAGKAGARELIGLANMNLGSVYLKSGKLDSALLLSKKAASVFGSTGFKTYLGYLYDDIGLIYDKKGDHALALQYYHKAAITTIAQNNLTTLGLVYRNLSVYYLNAADADSSLFYAKKTLAVMYLTGYKDKSKGYELLYKSYRLNHKPDSVTKYLELALTAKDSSYDATVKNLADFQKLSFQTQTRLNDLEKEKEFTRSRNRIYILLSTVIILLVLALIFYRNNRQKQKANHLLSEQKEEIETQRDQLSEALNELKATQGQLVQREKMASLGELTAGIAHEIQNPLNFVNNFSEVNKEMLEELKAESVKPKAERDEQLEIGLINDLIENEEKINQHGKRADSIVKGMLQHSRASSGRKEPTNLNALADEYLHLAFHGLRKDKSFNAEMVTSFDENIPAINIVPQDIGRVILNLLNNAFYATQQKAKTAGSAYKPTVEVKTSLKPGFVEIRVKDNGGGIPENIREKILQPFFTTKPTGEGTGLGLSLSYDIVTKGHGGKIEVNSKEREGSEFIITIPIKTA